MPVDAAASDGTAVGQATEVLLDVADLTVQFGIRHGLLGRQHPFTAVDDVSLTVRSGETLGLVGESGSGKTTLGYAILGRHRPASGHILFQGLDIASATREELREARRDMQMIFQDPFSSMNPRMSIVDVVGEPLVVHHRVEDRADQRAQVGALLERCGMSTQVLDRYPSEFSGGQRQRLVIARALALNPRLVVADEPTSALDVSVQAQILNLLKDLQEELGLAYLFISHNLAVVRHVADRIAIMFAGRIVETGSADDIFRTPGHPYTQALLAAIPVPDPTTSWLHHRRVAIRAAARTSTPAGAGCAYVQRCPLAIDRCSSERPPLAEITPGHQAACWVAAPPPPTRALTDSSTREGS